MKITKVALSAQRNLEIKNESPFDDTQVIDFFKSQPDTSLSIGETVEFGGSLLRVEGVNNMLIVQEPCFDGVTPINWKDGVGSSLQINTIQNLVADTLSTPPEFTSLRDGLLVEKDLTPSLNIQFEMERLPSDGENDSGWCIVSGFEENPEGEWKSIYEISCTSSIIIPFLGLPFGSHVWVNQNEIIVTYKSQSVCSASEELLDGIRSGGAWT